MSRFAGAYAAAVTPLTSGAEAVDVEAIPALVDFLDGAGIDGILALGTTGEGVLLDRAERRAAVRAFSSASRGRMTVIAHCGAQTTRETAGLAATAAEEGADAVAVIPPPYFALDDAELLVHLLTAALACAPLPFFVYEFAARSGYAVPLGVLAELRSQAPNLIGLKVSDSPWERVEPYLLDGLAVFVGMESYLARALPLGAAGTVSGLATALPELVVEAVRTGTAQASRRCAEVRARFEGLPFHASMKHVLRARGVAVGPDVRAPLRGLTAAEASALAAEVASLVAAPDPA